MVPVDVNAAREIVDSNSYLTLATAGADGVPWASPVWFAHDDYTAYFWMSQPTARHSQNIAQRPAIGIVIFDSNVSPRDRNAVFIEAVAEQVPDTELERVVAIYSARSVARGLEPLSVDEVAGRASFRLYRAFAAVHFVLEDEHDRRIEVTLSTGGASAG
jgi:nitroimidazol reductase NimA-like FMN-containing flavoprotein (pyridoxamine 5'-phosphate oxidase superfamily)